MSSAIKTFTDPHTYTHTHTHTHTERVLVVTEWCDDCIENHVRSGHYSNPVHLSKLTNQILSALEHLDNLGLVHRDLSPSNILLTPQVSRGRGRGMLNTEYAYCNSTYAQGEVKVHNYGLYHVTNHGKYVSFPIG